MTASSLHGAATLVGGAATASRGLGVEVGVPPLPGNGGLFAVALLLLPSLLTRDIDTGTRSGGM